jgi:hypothetical protein
MYRFNVQHQFIYNFRVCSYVQIKILTSDFIEEEIKILSNEKIRSRRYIGVLFERKKNHCAKLKKYVAYPQEDFLFIKLITCFRISLLNNCKKDLKFHIKT